MTFFVMKDHHTKLIECINNHFKVNHLLHVHVQTDISSLHGPENVENG